MKTILLPTDFSSNSINAIHYGLNLMKGEEVTIKILNVYDLPVIPSNDQAFLPTNYVAELIESSKKGLDRIKEIVLEEHPSENFKLN